MPIIPMQGDLRGDALKREAAAWTYALLCEPAVRERPAPQRKHKRPTLRPRPAPPSLEARRAFLVDGYRRLEVGEIARNLHDQGHPTAGVLSRIALGYEQPIFADREFDHTADPSALRLRTESEERGVLLAAYVASYFVIVGSVDPGRATLRQALQAFSINCPGFFHGSDRRYERRVWEKHEPAAPICLSYIVGCLEPSWDDPLHVLRFADAVAERLIKLDEQKPANRLFGDRDVFWRPPPSVTVAGRVRLTVPPDGSLGERICSGELNPVFVLARGGRRRVAQTHMPLTAQVSRDSVGCISPSDEIADD